VITPEYSSLAKDELEVIIITLDKLRTYKLKAWLALPAQQQSPIAAKMFSTIVLALFPALLSAQQLLRDPGIAGPPLEIVHLYNDQWPTGT
jgi:hypothetical protein